MGYKKIGEEKQRICTIWNKAKLYKNTKTMSKLLKVYESKDLKGIIITYGDLEYSDILREMYIDLFEIYKVQDVQKAYQLLYKVKDKKLKKGLIAKLVVE